MRDRPCCATNAASVVTGQSNLRAKWDKAHGIQHGATRFLQRPKPDPALPRHLSAPAKHASAAAAPMRAVMCGRCTSHFSRGRAVALPGMDGYQVKA